MVFLSYHFQFVLENFIIFCESRLFFPSVIFCGHAFKDARITGICLSPHEVSVGGLNAEVISHLHPILDDLALYAVIIKYALCQNCVDYFLFSVIDIDLEMWY